MIFRYAITPKQTRWTPTAIQCFERGCVCDGCFYEKFFTSQNFNCRMKDSVLELVRERGIPKKVKTKTIIGGENE